MHIDTAFHDIERSATISTAWDRWIANAEKFAGHSLDGDEYEGDGYSIDGAHDGFLAGMSPSLYVSGINRRKQEFAEAIRCSKGPEGYFETQRTRLHNFKRDEEFDAN